MMQPRYLGWKGPEGRRQLPDSCPCSTPLPHPPTAVCWREGFTWRGWVLQEPRLPKAESFISEGQDSQGGDLYAMFLQTSIPVFLGHLELGGKLGMCPQEAQMWSPPLHPSGPAPDTQSWRWLRLRSEVICPQQMPPVLGGRKFPRLACFLRGGRDGRSSAFVSRF